MKFSSREKLFCSLGIVISMDVTTSAIYDKPFKKYVLEKKKVMLIDRFSALNV